MALIPAKNNVRVLIEIWKSFTSGLSCRGDRKRRMTIREGKFCRDHPADKKHFLEVAVQLSVLLSGISKSLFSDICLVHKCHKCPENIHIFEKFLLK